MRWLFGPGVAARWSVGVGRPAGRRGVQGTSPPCPLRPGHGAGGGGVVCRCQASVGLGARGRLGHGRQAVGAAGWASCCWPLASCSGGDGSGVLAGPGGCMHGDGRPVFRGKG